MCKLYVYITIIEIDFLVKEKILVFILHIHSECLSFGLEYSQNSCFPSVINCKCLFFLRKC